MAGFLMDILIDVLIKSHYEYVVIFVTSLACCY